MFQRFSFCVGSFFAQLWLGTAFFLSFILAPVLFKSYPAETAADILSVIFPVYGWLLTICSGIALAVVVFFWRKRRQLDYRIYTIGLLAVIASLALNLLQTLYVFPASRTLRLMVKLGRAHKNIDNVAPQAEQLMHMHGISVAINNAIILLAIVAFWVFYRMAKNIDRDVKK